MFNKLHASQLAEQMRNQCIRHEIIETDILLPDEHKIAFKLIVLDQVYGVEILAKFANEETVQKIWMDLFSNLFADLNLGMAAKAQAK